MAPFSYGLLAGSLVAILVSLLYARPVFKKKEELAGKARQFDSPGYLNRR